MFLLKRNLCSERKIQQVDWTGNRVSAALDGKPCLMNRGPWLRRSKAHSGPGDKPTYEALITIKKVASFRQGKAMPMVDSK